MKKKIKMGIMLVGTLIGAISYWRIPYAELDFSDIKLWLFVGVGTLIGSFFSTLFFRQNPWQVALFITLGVVLAVLIRIIYDVTFWDSKSHNLAPFEMVYSVLQAWPMALVGAYAAMVLQKLKQ
jgi:uncharacterized membrane protein YfcA